MATTLFTQNTIACIWDFDKTLIPEYMQSPLFRRYGVDEAGFWDETNKLAEHYRKARETLDERARGTPGKPPIHPQHVARVVSELASHDAIFTCDVGLPTVWAARCNVLPPP